MLRKLHAICQVTLNLPAICRMRLVNIDDAEVRQFPKLLINPVKLGSLPTKRRSGITSEDKDDWTVPPERGNRDSGAILRVQSEGRDRITNCQAVRVKVAGIVEENFCFRGNIRCYV